MSLSKFSFSLVILAVLLATACSSTRPMKDQASDAAITTKITSKIAADPEVNPFRIDVDTTDGVVVLRGKVEKETARTEVAKHAMNTKGVVRVENQVTVVAPGESAMISDAGLATKVKSKIAADPELNPFNIDVDVSDGHVTLTGIVRSESAKAEAEKLANNTKGITGVTNELEVKPRGSED